MSTCLPAGSGSHSQLRPCFRLVVVRPDPGGNPGEAAVETLQSRSLHSFHQFDQFRYLDKKFEPRKGFKMVSRGDTATKAKSLHPLISHCRQILVAAIWEERCPDELCSSLQSRPLHSEIMFYIEYEMLSVMQGAIYIVFHFTVETIFIDPLIFSYTVYVLYLYKHNNTFMI